MHENNRLSPDYQWLFPEYDFEDVQLISHQGVIIERVLERGTWEQLRWLFNTFGEQVVANWIRKHGFRLLSKRSFALWSLSLDVKDFEAPDWAKTAKELDKW